MKKERYLVQLIFPTYRTSPLRAELSGKQFISFQKLLQERHEEGRIRGYVLAKPGVRDIVHAPILTAQALTIELEDLIATEERLSEER